MRSGRGYGAKSGKTASADFRLLGRKRAGSSLGPSRHHAQSACTRAIRQSSGGRLRLRSPALSRAWCGLGRSSPPTGRKLGRSPWRRLTSGPLSSLRMRCAPMQRNSSIITTSGLQALQLAAALEWCEDIPQGRVFLAADQKLREGMGSADLTGAGSRIRVFLGSRKKISP